MNLIGKKVRHSSYGQGTVTAFYPANNTIRLVFENQPARPYDILADFDSGLLESDEQAIHETIAYIKSLPSYRLSSKALGERKTEDKDLSAFLTDCQQLLEELGIKIGVIESVGVENRLDRWGVCKSLGNGRFRILISQILLQDEAPDWMVYQTLLHELLHAAEACCGHGHNKKWKQLAAIINRKCGYDISAKDRWFDYLLLDAVGSWPHFKR